MVKMRGSTSLTDLDKIRQDGPPIKFPPQQQQSQNKYHEKEKHDQRFFDSRGHRICFELLHIKIGTYVFCTLVLQEIVFGLIFLLTRDEVKRGDITARIVILMLCRIIQMPPLAFLYAGLYKYKRFFLLPFALSQVTLGPFADISTFMMIVKDYEDNSYPLPFLALPWLNIVIPLFIYMVVVVLLMYVLYRCFVYFRAWTVHSEKYQQEPSTVLPLCRGNDISDFSSKFNTKGETLLTSAI
jgi:hypothetical protein